MDDLMINFTEIYDKPLDNWGNSFGQIIQFPYMKEIRNLW